MTEGYPSGKATDEQEAKLPVGPTDEQEASPSKFSVTVALASGKTIGIEDLSPADKLKDLKASVAAKMVSSVRRITLMLGGRVFQSTDSGKTLDELGIGEGAALSCIRGSMWMELVPNLLECDLPVEERWKWACGGVDAQTGLMLLVAWTRELTFETTFMVVPLESTGQSPYKLEIPKLWTSTEEPGCKSSECPGWVDSFTHYGHPQPLIVSGGHCVLIEDSQLVHFQFEPGVLSPTVVPSTATAVGVDMQEERIILATAEGEIQARPIASITESELLFKDSRCVEITSLVCNGKYMFLASKDHMVHIYAAGEGGWIHSLSIGDGQKGTLGATPPRVHHPRLFSSPGPDGAFLLSDNDLYSVSNLGKLVFQSKVRDEDFIMPDDNGSPDPIARQVLGVHNQRVFRIIEQSWYDPYPLRCLNFGS